MKKNKLLLLGILVFSMSFSKIAFADSNSTKQTVTEEAITFEYAAEETVDSDNVDPDALSLSHSQTFIYHLSSIDPIRFFESETILGDTVTIFNEYDSFGAVAITARRLDGTYIASTQLIYPGQSQDITIPLSLFNSGYYLQATATGGDGLYIFTVTGTSVPDPGYDTDLVQLKNDDIQLVKTYSQLKTGDQLILSNSTYSPGPVNFYVKIGSGAETYIGSCDVGSSVTYTALANLNNVSLYVQRVNPVDGVYIIFSSVE